MHSLRFNANTLFPLEEQMKSTTRLIAALVLAACAAGASAAKTVVRPVASAAGTPCLFRPAGATTLVNLNSLTSVRAYAGHGTDSTRWYVTFNLGTSSIEVQTDAKGAESMLDAVASTASACRT